MPTASHNAITKAIVEGKSLVYFHAHEHLAKSPTYGHALGIVKALR